MCNLTTADFFLGLYLLILATYDYYTSGVYFNYAIKWQYEAGCNLVGFLSTFSTVLSVYTLTVLTIERWYAISHAINITKRIRLKQASYIMIGGWIFSLTYATLPLLGISNYNKTSICLPMETQAKIPDKIYVFTLLLMHLVCFFVICVCYVDMYRQVHTQRSAVDRQGRQSAVGKKDASVAKRMAILVFTDFACLFPIAFFGLTAAAGKPLITLTQSKIILVFFFPLNACANPFLYAITTQQFKKDLFSTLGRCGLCEQRARRYRAPYSTFHYSSSNAHSRAYIKTRSQGHRSSQGSVKSTYISSKFSSSTISHGSHGRPNNSPKNKKKIYESVTSSTGSASAMNKYQTVLCTSTAVSISKDVRKLSVVPEVSPKRSAAVSAEEEQQVLEKGPAVEQGQGQNVTLGNMSKEGNCEEKKQEKSHRNQDDMSQKPLDHKVREGNHGDLNQDGMVEEEEEETTEMGRKRRTVRSVSQYSTILAKQGSVEYEKLNNPRKGSQSTTTTTSFSSSGSACTETSMLSSDMGSSFEGNNGGGIETIAEEQDHEDHDSGEGQTEDTDVND